MLGPRIPACLIGLAVLLEMTAAAPAQVPAGRLERLKEYLALTDAQTAQMKQLFTKQKEAIQPLRQQLKENRVALQAALAATPPNPTTVGELAIAQHGLQTKLRDLNAKLKTDFDAILTPEQKIKLDALMSLRRRWTDNANRLP